ncbi:hypothetical protein Taro_050395 [Colocasia esculenta]|uniref:Aminotransferase-like plant mobile domain-containing protein n=1 Tax=Colocasia esculenta TaxID=4460 RepID=A0A843XDR2_COLES|nr:hypothetical protein [Colocasia esculenta]
MRARVSWILVLAVYLAFPRFQIERLDDMGFGEVLRMERMRADAPLTQALRSRWDVEATAFMFPWGLMIPNLEDVSRITGLRVYGRPVSGFTYPCYQGLACRLLDLTESLGLFQTSREVGEIVKEQLSRLGSGCKEVLASEPGAQGDLDLRCFLTFFLGRLLFATRGDAVHCRFLPLLEDLGQVGDYAWGAAFLAHQFESLGSFDRKTSISGFFPFLQVWTYLHLPGLRRGTLERPSLMSIARRWVPCRDMHPLEEQLASIQDAIDVYPQLDRSLGLHQSAVEFPSRGWTPRPGRSFRALHDTTDWREQARKKIEDSEHRGRRVRSEADSDDAYLQAFALKYGAKVDVAGEITSLWALLHSAIQDREVAQREVEHLLASVRRLQAGASSSRATMESSQSDLTNQLASTVRRAEEAYAELTERVTELRTTTDQTAQLQE